jgi:hypothetical protein
METQMIAILPHSLHPTTSHARVPLSYSDFTIEEVKSRFQLQTEEDRDLFGAIAPVEIGAILPELLREYVPLALAISTEKARSELIISPVLMEARRQSNRTVSVFSGIDFSVDPEQGLRGQCDFILSRSREQMFVEAPVLAIAEAKNENFKVGIGQCLAEMVGAQLFNTRRGQASSIIYGAVTTGNNWKFLRLEGTTACLDLVEYHISDVRRIVGILVSMLNGTAP